MNRRLTRWVLAALMAYPVLILTQGAAQAAASRPARRPNPGPLTALI